LAPPRKNHRKSIEKTEKARVVVGKTKKPSKEVLAFS